MFKTLLVLSILAGSAAEALAMDSTSQFTWRNRVLLVFGTAASPQLSRQIAALKGQTAALAERDMVVLQVTPDAVTQVFGTAGDIQPAQLRKDLKVTDDRFEIVLIGKDGGVKLRSKTVVSDAEVFDLIDRMPMRRAGEK